MVKKIRIFHPYHRKEWSLFLLFLISTSLLIPTSVRALSVTEENSIVELAIWRASTVWGSLSKDSMNVGYSDGGNFEYAYLSLLSQFDPQWLHYNLDYSFIDNKYPVFTPAGSLQINRQSTTESSKLATPQLTFRANTSKGPTTNFLWLNPSLLNSDLEELQFSVPYTEAFIHAWPWRLNQSSPHGLWFWTSHPEPWNPLLNFSSRQNLTHRGIEPFIAQATLSTSNYTLKYHLTLTYLSNGLLSSFYYIFQKNWDEGNSHYKSDIHGYVSLLEANFTSNLLFSESSTNDMIHSAFLSGILMLIPLIIFTRRKRKE